MYISPGLFAMCLVAALLKGRGKSFPTATPSYEDVDFFHREHYIPPEEWMNLGEVESDHAAWSERI